LQLATANQLGASQKAKADAAQHRVTTLQADLESQHQQHLAWQEGMATAEAASSALRAELATAVQACATAEQKLASLQVRVACISAHC